MTERADERLAQPLTEYLATKLPHAASLKVSGLVRPSVGWSHEIWLFDLSWNDDVDHHLGLCLRIDPETRSCELSRIWPNNSECSSAWTPHPSRRRTPTGTKTIRVSSGPPSSSWSASMAHARVHGAGRARPFTRRRRPGGSSREASPETLATLHTLDWESAGLSFLGGRPP